MFVVLVPYLALTIVYLAVYKVHSAKPEGPSWCAAFWKCLPIFYLILLVAMAPRAHDNHHWYKTMVTTALVFSLLGDFFLVWFKQYFIPGVACFAIAQVCYSLAFGFAPLNWEVGLVVALAGVLLYSVLHSGLSEVPMRVVVALYITVIGTMAWRASVLYQTTHRYEALYTVLGAWIFAVSDSLIAVNAWRWRVPRGVFWIMTTYYVAQALLALSAFIPGWRASGRMQFVGI